jgi:hypothetical protein
MTIISLLQLFHIQRDRDVQALLLHYPLLPIFSFFSIYPFSYPYQLVLQSILSTRLVGIVIRLSVIFVDLVLMDLMSLVVLNGLSRIQFLPSTIVLAFNGAGWADGVSLNTRLTRISRIVQTDVLTNTNRLSLFCYSPWCPYLSISPTHNLLYFGPVRHCLSFSFTRFSHIRQLP